MISRKHCHILMIIWDRGLTKPREITSVTTMFNNSQHLLCTHPVQYSVQWMDKRIGTCSFSSHTMSMERTNCSNPIILHTNLSPWQTKILQTLHNHLLCSTRGKSSSDARKVTKKMQLNYLWRMYPLLHNVSQQYA